METGPNERKNLRHYVELVTGSFEQKKRWRQHQARMAQLPAGHRAAGEALQRYLLYFGPSGDGDSLLSMLDDLAELFEQSAVDGTTVRAVVGEDPVEFAEEFVRNYQGSSWINKERERLTDAIDRAAGASAGHDGSAR